MVMDIQKLFSMYATLKNILSQNIVFELVNLQKGKKLIEQGETPNSFYILLSGSLKVEHIIDDGRILFISYLYPYDFIGDLEFVLNSNNVHQVTVVTPSKLIKFSKYEYNRLMKEDPRFVMSINKSLAKKLKDTTENFVNHAYRPLKDRLLTIIYKELKSVDFKSNFSVSINLPREQIAEQLGVTIRSINRVIKELKEHGMIQTKKQNIIINEIGLYLIKKYMEENDQTF